MIPISVLIIIIIFCFYFFTKNKKVITEGEEDKIVDTAMMEKHILFYSKLSPEDKKKFESDIKDFLQTVQITAVDTTINDLDRLYVAAGAVIPIFRFTNWKYRNLKEVLIYSDTFNHDFQSSGDAERDILGMVGSGYMEGKMLLSKPALELGFTNKTDKNNTVIHEFVHLIDKSDGETDGVPQLLLDQQYTLPWLDLIHKEIKRIVDGKSDINPYGYTNQAEFFAVASEYFFERPDLLEEKHPELYKLLVQIFNTEK